MTTELRTALSQLIANELYKMWPPDKMPIRSKLALVSDRLVRYSVEGSDSDEELFADCDEISRLLRQEMGLNSQEAIELVNELNHRLGYTLTKLTLPVREQLRLTRRLTHQLLILRLRLT